MSSSFDYESNFISSVLTELESYLLGKELFRLTRLSAPSGLPPYPSLTLGTLLLSLLKARALAAHPKQTAQITHLEHEINAYRQRWRSAWEKKAHSEAQNRIAMWRTFLGELFSAPAENLDRYPYEVRQRVMIELLKDEMNIAPDSLQKEIEQSDSLLRGMLKPAQFLWPSELEPSFPAERFWFLWGKP